jgi:D-alanyl-D-alanine carboxypeptidase
MRRTGILICLSLAILLGLSFATTAQTLPDGSSALDFIAHHPDDVAVLCYTPGENPQVEHHADEPFPLASTYKLVILAELARQAEAGLIDPSEAVPLADINAYWLPGTDGNAHQMFLDSLPKGQKTITLQEAANGMIHYSSNAVADYLLSRLGKNSFPELFKRLGLKNTDLPEGTFLSLYLANENHQNGKVNPANLEANTLAAERERLERLFLADAGWRKAQLAYVEQIQAAMQQAMNGKDYGSLGVEYERPSTFFTKFGAKGSARDMLRLLESAYRGDIFSEKGKTVMQSALGWVFEVNPANRKVYDVLAMKGGSWAGIMTGAWYVVPKAGNPLELAVFYRNLPPELWGDWFTSGAQQALELRAIAYGEGCKVFADALR